MNQTHSTHGPHSLAESEAGPHRVAIVGSGPRGLSVLERMAARLMQAPPERPVEIHLIDAVRVGSGRIWRDDQPDWFLMNTVAGEVSAFSGESDGGTARPGAGPSLSQWWSSVDPAAAGDHRYAPRAVHGRYMHFVLDSIEAALPPQVRLHRVLARVDDLQPEPQGYRLLLSGGAELFVDRVILVTGHAQPELSGLQRTLAEFAASNRGLRYVPGDSAADMPLEAIPAGSAVGILGLGLSFYDVVAALTIGRGGTFTDDGAGGLSYLPSGLEPVLVAGSRGGVPVLARGRNQKHASHRYQTLLFTVDRVRASSTGPRLDFLLDVMPWLTAEIDLVYYATALRTGGAPAAAAAFTAEVVAAAVAGVPDVVAIAVGYGLGGLPRVSLDELARPFTGRSFADHAAFERELVAMLRRDLVHAEQGNVDSPLKAALDVIRDTRGVIRELVDFGGLDPDSHRAGFLGWYVQRSSFLAAGPPRSRLYQICALIQSGVLRFVGPAAVFAGDPESGRFVVSSPQVAGSQVAVDTVVDARVPSPDLAADPSPLTVRLRERGIWTSYVNGDGSPNAFVTGGVAVTTSPFHPIDRAGAADTGLYVLGIPTEHTRWFMQGGSSRPQFWTDFVRDADAIAADALNADNSNADAPRADSLDDADSGYVTAAQPDAARRWSSVRADDGWKPVVAAGQLPGGGDEGGHSW